MHILLLSDTHGYLDDDILGYAEAADEVWHAGDIGPGPVVEALENCAPVRVVYGNIDDARMRRDIPEDLHFEVAGLKVFMTHIGGYPGRYKPRVRKTLDAFPDTALFVCGHSHILKVMPDRKRGLLHMNPGACGVHGFHKVRTMIRFQIEEGRIIEPAAIELRVRGTASA